MCSTGFTRTYPTGYEVLIYYFDSDIWQEVEVPEEYVKVHRVTPALDRQ